LVTVAVSIAPLGIVLSGLVNEIQDNESWGGIVIWALGAVGLFALCCGMMIAPTDYHRRILFDRRTGMMTMSRRPFWRPAQIVQSRPLRDIIAIQLLYGGHHCDTLDFGGEQGTPGSVHYINYDSYQLNLVLADSEQPRYNLTTHADFKWMRETGHKLADFLGIPLLDQLLPTPIKK
jgi:hypothetical protein